MLLLFNLVAPPRIVHPNKNPHTDGTSIWGFRFDIRNIVLRS